MPKQKTLAELNAEKDKIEQQLAQGGLARRAGPDDRQRLPRRHPE